MQLYNHEFSYSINRLTSVYMTNTLYTVRYDSCFCSMPINPFAKIPKLERQLLTIQILYIVDSYIYTLPLHSHWRFVQAASLHRTCGVLLPPLHGVFAPNSKHWGLITFVRRGKGKKGKAPTRIKITHRRNTTQRWPGPGDWNGHPISMFKTAANAVVRWTSSRVSKTRR